MNSSEINVYDTGNITWTRNEFHKSEHEVELYVTGDNFDYFGDGRLAINVRIMRRVTMLNGKQFLFSFVLHSNS